jgi:hypothetical protein
VPNDFVNSETYYISALIIPHYVSKFALYTVNPGKSNVFQESDKKLFVTYTLQRFTNAIRRYTNAILMLYMFVNVLIYRDHVKVSIYRDHVNVSINRDHANVLIYRHHLNVSIYRDIGNVMWYYQRH